MTVDPEAVDDLLGRIDHDVERGRLPAAQIAVAVHGELVVDRAWGCALRARLPMYSTSKVLVAAASWRLLGSGAMTETTRVAEVLPWFIGGGKEDIRVHHLLEHTAGIPRAPLGPPEWSAVETRRAAMAGWYTTSTPGTEFEYHATSASWVLAELIAELCGVSHCEAIHDLVTEPMGLPQLLGVDDTMVDVVDLVPVGAGDDAPGSRGVDVPSEITDATMLRFNQHDVRLLGVPGGGGMGSAADVAMAYQHLLDDRLGLFSPDVLREGTGVVRVALPDALRGCPANRTLGLVLAGDDGASVQRGFGTAVSPRAFGHDGAAGQVAFADPDFGLSVCFLNSALDADLMRQVRRSIAVANKAVACVAGSERDRR